MPVRLTDNIEYGGRSPKKRKAQSSEDLSEITEAFKKVTGTSIPIATYNDLQTKIIQACDGVTATQVDISRISDNLKERIDKIEMELLKRKEE